MNAMQSCRVRRGVRTTRSARGTRRPGRTWRAAAVAATLGCAAVSAQAQSWFQFEAGIGIAKSADMGDGTWYQQALPHKEKLISPAWMLGITGDPFKYLSYHVDFVYLGKVSADTLAVYDDDYDPTSHRVLHAPAPISALTGSGRTMGIALTLEPNYTWHGVRFGVEGGPFIFRGTWNDTITNPDGTVKYLSHPPKIQLGYVLGASVGYKDFGVQYRYYMDKTKYEPVPGLTSHTSTLMVTYRHSFW